MDLPAHELVAVTGGNGSGKSTLLRILVGVSRPTTGRVLDRPSAVGYVPDRFPADERMSARSYLANMGRVRGHGSSAAARAEALLERLVLVGDASAPLRTLSRGNLQKVALAQALLTPPRLLVLDEPWSGLDSSAHGILAEIMAETTRDGGTVVFTDHRESVVRANSTRIYRVADERVTPDEATTAPRGEVRIVVKAPVNELGIPLSADWRALDGVLTARADGEHVTIHVDATRSDDVILVALRDGWSLVEARHVQPVSS